MMTASPSSLTRAKRTFVFNAAAILALSPGLAYYTGKMIGPGVLHPWRLPISLARLVQVEEMLRKTDAVAMRGGFNTDEISQDKSVTQRAFPVLVICGKRDRRIPCRHAEQIFKATIGPKEF